MENCNHEYTYENWVINCYKCGNTWDITDMVNLASRVPRLERECEEWKIRASDLSHTISEMKIGTKGLLEIIDDAVSWMSAAKKSHPTLLLPEWSKEFGLTPRAADTPPER